MTYTQHPLSAAKPTFTIPSNQPHWDFLFDGQRWQGVRINDLVMVCITPVPAQQFWTFSGQRVRESMEILSRRPCARWMIESYLRELGIEHDDDWRVVADAVKSESQEPESASDQQSRVYFIRAGAFVKIGYSNNVAARMEGFQTGCPQRLELLAAVPGGQEQEAELHRKFAALRYRGEWFHYDAAIVRYIGLIQVAA